MAFMIKDNFDLKGILFLMLLSIPSEATTNLDCHGKPFHCVNSTHFMICVDLGSGISTTIDDVVIPCPSITACRPTNRFECEFPAPSASELQVSTVATNLPIESEVTTNNPPVTATVYFEEYYKTLSYTTLSDIQQSTTSTSEDPISSLKPTADIYDVTNANKSISTDVSAKSDSVISNISVSSVSSTVTNISLNNEATTVINKQELFVTTDIKTLVADAVLTKNSYGNFENVTSTDIDNAITEQTVTTTNVLTSVLQVPLVNLITRDNASATAAVIPSSKPEYIENKLKSEINVILNEFVSDNDSSVNTNIFKTDSQANFSINLPITETAVENEKPQVNEVASRDVKEPVIHSDRYVLENVTSASVSITEMINAEEFLSTYQSGFNNTTNSDLLVSGDHTTEGRVIELATLQPEIVRNSTSINVVEIIDDQVITLTTNTIKSNAYDSNRKENKPNEILFDVTTGTRNDIKKETSTYVDATTAPTVTKDYITQSFENYKTEKNTINSAMDTYTSVVVETNTYYQNNLETFSDKKERSTYVNATTAPTVTKDTTKSFKNYKTENNTLNPATDIYTSVAVETNTYYQDNLETFSDKNVRSTYVDATTAPTVTEDTTQSFENYKTEKNTLNSATDTYTSVAVETNTYYQDNLEKISDKKGRSTYVDATTAPTISKDTTQSLENNKIENNNRNPATDTYTSLLVVTNTYYQDNLETFTNRSTSQNVVSRTPVLAQKDMESRGLDQNIVNATNMLEMNVKALSSNFPDKKPPTVSVQPEFIAYTTLSDKENLSQNESVLFSTSPTASNIFVHVTNNSKTYLMNEIYDNNIISSNISNVTNHMKLQDITNKSVAATSIIQSNPDQTATTTEINNLFPSKETATPNKLISLTSYNEILLPTNNFNVETSTTTIYMAEITESLASDSRNATPDKSAPLDLSTSATPLDSSYSTIHGSVLETNGSSILKENKKTITSGSTIGRYVPDSVETQKQSTSGLLLTHATTTQENIISVPRIGYPNERASILNSTPTSKISSTDYLYTRIYEPTDKKSVTESILQVSNDRVSESADKGSTTQDYVNAHTLYNEYVQTTTTQILVDQSSNKPLINNDYIDITDNSSTLHTDNTRQVYTSSPYPELLSNENFVVETPTESIINTGEITREGEQKPALMDDSSVLQDLGHKQITSTLPLTDITTLDPYTLSVTEFRKDNEKAIASVISSTDYVSTTLYRPYDQTPTDNEHNVSNDKIGESSERGLTMQDYINANNGAKHFQNTQYIGDESSDRNAVVTQTSNSERSTDTTPLINNYNGITTAHGPLTPNTDKIELYYTTTSNPELFSNESIVVEISPNDNNGITNNPSIPHKDNTRKVYASLPYPELLSNETFIFETSSMDSITNTSEITPKGKQTPTIMENSSILQELGHIKQIPSTLPLTDITTVEPYTVSVPEFRKDNKNTSIFNNTLASVTSTDYVSKTALYRLTDQTPSENEHNISHIKYSIDQSSDGNVDVRQKAYAGRPTKITLVDNKYNDITTLHVPSTPHSDNTELVNTLTPYPNLLPNANLVEEGPTTDSYFNIGNISFPTESLGDKNTNIIEEHTHTFVDRAKVLQDLNVAPTTTMPINDNIYSNNSTIKNNYLNDIVTQPFMDGGDSKYINNNFGSKIVPTTDTKSLTPSSTLPTGNNILNKSSVTIIPATLPSVTSFTERRYNIVESVFQTTTPNIYNERNAKVDLVTNTTADKKILPSNETGLLESKIYLQSVVPENYDVGTISTDINVILSKISQTGKVDTKPEQQTEKLNMQATRENSDFGTVITSLPDVSIVNEKLNINDGFTVSNNEISSSTIVTTTPYFSLLEPITYIDKKPNNLQNNIGFSIKEQLPAHTDGILTPSYHSISSQFVMKSIKSQLPQKSAGNKFGAVEPLHQTNQEIQNDVTSEIAKDFQSSLVTENHIADKNVIEKSDVSPIPGESATLSVTKSFTITVPTVLDALNNTKSVTLSGDKYVVAKSRINPPIIIVDDKLPLNENFSLDSVNGRDQDSLIHHTYTPTSQINTPFESMHTNQRELLKRTIAGPVSSTDSILKKASKDITNAENIEYNTTTPTLTAEYRHNAFKETTHSAVSKNTVQDSSGITLNYNNINAGITHSKAVTNILPEVAVTSEIIIGSDVVEVNKNTETEKTHSDIISLLRNVNNNNEKGQEDSPVQKNPNNINIFREKSDIKKIESEQNVDTPAKEIFSNPINITLTPLKGNNSSTRKEIIITNENNDFQTYEKNKEQSFTLKLTTINNPVSSVKAGENNKVTPTLELLEYNTDSKKDTHTSNTNSQDQNKNTSYVYNKTFISKDQSRTPYDVTETTLTAVRIAQTEFPAFESTTSNPRLDNFTCKNKSRGRYADELDCRKFFICIGHSHFVEGTCPINTVFSEITKQCTKNLSQCIRNNQFRCVTEGRFGDFLKDNVYYICVKNNVSSFTRFKLQCQNGYRLNKTSVRCVLNNEFMESTSGSEVSKNNSDQSISSATSEPENKNDKLFKCKKEGIFADPTDCRRYFQCIKTEKRVYKQKRKKCDSDEVFHKDKKKCVDDESYECN